MEKNNLENLKKNILQLSEMDLKLHNIYLSKLAKGEIQGPSIGYPSLDKPWLKWYNEDSIMAEMEKGKSTFNYLRDNNIKNMNLTAINYYGNLISYRKFFEDIDNLTKKYSALGIKNGDIISICMPSTPETIESFYALNRLGAISDMIDPRSNTSQLDYYLKQNKSKYLIICANYYKILKPAIDKNNLDKVIVLPITISMPSYSSSFPYKFKMVSDIKTNKEIKEVGKESNTLMWNEFMKGNSNDNYCEELNKENSAIIIHSSGTTSLPKGIVLSNDNLNAIAFQYANTSLNLKPGMKFLSVIPAFASFGMVASINLPFNLAMENILLPIVNGKIFVNSFKKNKINFTLTVPGNFLALSKSKKNIDLSELYGPGAGGYSLNAVLEKQVKDYMLKNNAPSPMLMGWGMSELSSTATLETNECSKDLSSGIPLVSNNVSIFKLGTDEELGYNEEGEICVTGPTVMQYYLNNQEKTAKTKMVHSDGTVWLHSGDIGYMDNDGRLYVSGGREDRMIKRGADGFKMSPLKIENIIATSNYIDTCCVVGFDTMETGVIIKAYLVLKKEFIGHEKQALDDTKQKCKENLSIRAIPEKFEFIDSLPYTPMGKVDYKKLETDFSVDNNKKLVKKI